MTFLSKEVLKRIRSRFSYLYGEANADNLMNRLFMMIGRYGVGIDVPEKEDHLWDEKDVVLITYADMVQDGERSPLRVLREFLRTHFKQSINNIHLLPFTKWSSDDGFSVIDYREVDERYGTWTDVEMLGEDFRLMFDLVLNHCSRLSQWFQDYTTGIAPARYYFLPMDPTMDLSAVTRPRPWPLLTRTMTRDGEAFVWTTFSEDQVDLNWQNPDVFFEFLDILFLYIDKGVRIIRLDAVAFLWKNIGTNCLHQPQTHEVVKLFRDVLSLVAPHVILLTETNVPHEENVSYFGQGDEAHMVYNFSLPPLLLYSLLKNDATVLTEWSRRLSPPPEGCTYFNFTASHDGIGVRPLEGLLNDAEIGWLVDEVRARDGRVGVKDNGDGTQSPYELNITYFSALSDSEDVALGINRFLCSQAVILAFKGIPAVYFHSLVATENNIEGVVAPSGENRSINRLKWDLEELNARLKDKDSAQAEVFSRYLRVLRRRNGHAAFHPDASMTVYDIGSNFFSFTRTAIDKSEKILCLYNFTPEKQKLKLADLHDRFGVVGNSIRDIYSATTIKAGPRRNITFQPYQVMWLVVR